MVVMNIWRRRRGAAAVALAAVGLAGALSGCSSTSSGGSAGTGPDAAHLDVVAAFYPLEYLAANVGDGLVSLTTLAPPGAEPHDLELTPSDLRDLAEADLVVYLRGFMPAVDDAVAQLPPEHVWDAGAHADLDLQLTTADGTTTTDPHFWLDPVRYARVGTDLAAALADLDSTSAGTYQANARTLATSLATLDGEWRQGTSTCANRFLVTAHTAFGYLAQRYGFTQHGVTGLSPGTEPTPRQLADTAAFVRANDVATIYTETLASPAVAETVAAETGARTAVLDPVEGLTDASPGRDYHQVMRANLATVRDGQPCS